MPQEIKILSKIKLNGEEYEIRDRSVEAELDSNITSMLQGLGLNTSTTLSPAEADETAAGSSVLTS